MPESQPEAAGSQLLLVRSRTTKRQDGPPPGTERVHTLPGGWLLWLMHHHSCSPALASAARWLVSASAPKGRRFDPQPWLGCM